MQNTLDNFEFYKKIDIPHIYYTLYIADMSKLQGVEKQGSGYFAVFSDQQSVIFLENIKKNINKKVFIPVIAHEVMHAIQHICEFVQMNIVEEKEHTAHLMSYILCEIFELNGWKPVDHKQNK